MRGSIRKRYKDSWHIILDIGYQIVPATGRQKRVQKWFTVKGTKREAERKLTELLHHLHRGEYVEPSKLTVGSGCRSGWRRALSPPINGSGPMRRTRVSLRAI
jgi:hypothetical protein